MNTPHGNSVTAAEHTIAMMCAMARRIPQADRSTRGGGWERGRFMGIELRDKTLGIVGCGTIGAIVATLAQGLRMRVVAYDPYLAPDRAAALGVTLATMDELLRRRGRHLPPRAAHRRDAGHHRRRRAGANQGKACAS